MNNHSSITPFTNYSNLFDRVNVYTSQGVKVPCEKGECSLFVLGFTLPFGFH